MGQCNNGNFVNDEMTRRALMVPLVPAKMAGCSFKICARVTQPYIEEGCNQGLEIQLLKTLQTSMEFTVNVPLTSCMRVISNILPRHRPTSSAS